MKLKYKLDAEEQLKSYLDNMEIMIFPESGSPLVSIIIVTYTQTAMELLCLKSVLKHMEGIPYEVVISNNGSSDVNTEFLCSLRNVVIIKNGGNIGFVKGVNTGAAAATGKYLFLLNDDAVLTEGCVQALLKTIDPWEKTKIGVIGGQLRSLDGKLQDAGGVLWKNGAAAEYGKGEDPKNGLVNFLRDVSYVSGACFMTPNILFSELGGFDEAFSPGYCEESDYCCRVRSLGYRIVYEPFAKIIHYEYGSSKPADVDKLVSAHTKLLYGKHKQLLHESFDSRVPMVYARTTRRYSGRALIISDGLPKPELGEDSQKLIDLIIKLDKHNIFVTLLPLSSGTESWEEVYKYLPRTTEVLLHEGLSNLPRILAERPRFYDYVITRESDSARPDKLSLPNTGYIIQWDLSLDDLINKTNFFDEKYVIQLDKDESYDADVLKELYKPTLLWVDWHIPEYDSNAGDYAVHSYCSLFKELGFKIKYWSDDPNWQKQNPKYIRKLEAEGWDIWNSEIDFEKTIMDLGHTVDLVVLARPLSSNYINHVKNYTRAPIMYYCHDLHYLRLRRAGTALNRQDLLVEAENSLRVERFLIGKSDLFVTVSEAERDIVNEGMPEVHTSVWPWYSPVKEVAKRPERGRILFLGGLQHTPNLDAIKWFINEIYPTVKEKLNNQVQFDILGSHIPEEIQELHDGDFIFVRGFIEQTELGNYFTDAHLLVAPIRFGAGFKGKIATSMSFGLPVVTTTVGVEGMRLLPGNNILIGDDKESFAQSIVDLITNETLWNTISTQALSYAQTHWSGEAVKGVLIEDMKRLNVRR